LGYIFSDLLFMNCFLHAFVSELGQELIYVLLEYTINFGWLSA
jgi:hypothetical protein